MLTNDPELENVHWLNEDSECRCAVGAQTAAAVPFIETYPFRLRKVGIIDNSTTS